MTSISSSQRFVCNHLLFVPELLHATSSALQAGFAATTLNLSLVHLVDTSFSEHTVSVSTKLFNNEFH